MARIEIFAGRRPPDDRSFDWVMSPEARVIAKGQPRIPTLDEVDALVEDAERVITAMCDGREARLLRDEVTGLVRSVAVVEVIRRAVSDQRSVRILAERSVARPSSLADPGGALAARTGASIEYQRRLRVTRVPNRAVSLLRTARQLDFASMDRQPGVLFAIGGPSESRAVAPVIEATKAVSGVFGFAAGRDPKKRASLPIRVVDIPRPIDHTTYLEHISGAWRRMDWWGRAWFPDVEPSLRALAVVTLREAWDHHSAASRLLVDAKALVTAKVRWAPARAVVAAANELGVPTVGLQHGLYRDGSEWQDIGVDVFATAGSSFASILRSRAYRGEIEVAGAPFYAEHQAMWDCVIALRPPEGDVLANSADYARHARSMYEAARSTLPGGSIGFRLHPRESEGALRSMFGSDLQTTRDHTQGGKIWLAVESSVVVEAAINGSRVVLANLNGHQWHYAFPTLQGVSVAESDDDVADSMRRAVETPADADSSRVWRDLYAQSVGRDAGEKIAAIVDRVAS